VRIAILALLLAPCALAADTTASWYGEELRGHPTATGEPFDPDGFTVASWDYPLGTWLLLEAPATGIYCWVRVNDRGPARRLHAQGRTLDLSREAFRYLSGGFLDDGGMALGLIRVRIAATALADW